MININKVLVVSSQGTDTDQKGGSLDIFLLAGVNALMIILVKDG